MFLKIMSFLSGLAGILAIGTIGLIIPAMSAGHEGGTGMVLLVFGFYAIIFVIIALLTGFVAYFVANNKALPLPLMGKIGLWLGGASGVIMTLALFLSQ